MARIALYKDNYADSTVVSNLFIDEYMKDANDAQLKVYFYLLRMLNADQAISVSGIADKFNHTEKDVIRALKYWEKQQILDLDFDENKALVGIHLRDLSAQATPAPQHNVLLTSGSVQAQNTAGSHDQRCCTACADYTAGGNSCLYQARLFPGSVAGI